MALKKTQVDTIAQTVYRRYPELGGVTPQVRNQVVGLPARTPNRRRAGSTCSHSPARR